MKNNNEMVCLDDVVKQHFEKSCLIREHLLKMPDNIANQLANQIVEQVTNGQQIHVNENMVKSVMKNEIEKSIKTLIDNELINV